MGKYKSACDSLHPGQLDRLSNKIKDSQTEATKPQNPVGSTLIAGSVTPGFIRGMFFLEEKLLDWMQENNWDNVKAVDLVAKTSEIINKNK